MEHMKFRTSHRYSWPRAGLVLSSLLLLGLFYFKFPTLAFDFAGIYVVLLVAAIPAVALTARLGLIAAYTALTVLFGVTVFLTSAPIVRADAYYKMLGTETAANFHDALPPIDIEWRATSWVPSQNGWTASRPRNSSSNRCRTGANTSTASST